MSRKSRAVEELSSAPEAAESEQVKGGMIIGPFKPTTPVLTTGGTTTTTNGGTTTNTSTGEPGFTPTPQR